MIERALELASLAQRPAAKARLLVAATGLYLRRLSNAASPIGLPITIDGKETTVRVADVGDLKTLVAVLRRGEYKPPIDAASVVVDLGSNIGASVLHFASMWPTARIYGFEPLPRAFELLACNVGHLPNVSIQRVAVGSTDGDATFYDTPWSQGASLFPRQHARKRLQVCVRRLDTLLADLELRHVDLLKIDVEGAEFEAVADSTRITSVRAIIAEVHTDLAGKTVNEFVQLLPPGEVHVESTPAPPAGRFKVVWVNSAFALTP